MRNDLSSIDHSELTKVNGGDGSAQTRDELLARALGPGHFVGAPDWSRAGRNGSYVSGRFDTADGPELYRGSVNVARQTVSGDRIGEPLHIKQMPGR